MCPSVCLSVRNIFSETRAKLILFDVSGHVNMCSHGSSLCYGFRDLSSVPLAGGQTNGSNHRRTDQRFNRKDSMKNKRRRLARNREGSRTEVGLGAGSVDDYVAHVGLVVAEVLVVGRGWWCWGGGGGWYERDPKNATLHDNMSRSPRLSDLRKSVS